MPSPSEIKTGNMNAKGKLSVEVNYSLSYPVNLPAL